MRTSTSNEIAIVFEAGGGPPDDPVKDGSLGKKLGKSSDEKEPKDD